MQAHSLGIRCVFAVLGACACALVVIALQVVARDIHFTSLETEVSFWGRGSYEPTVSTRTHVDAQLQMALQNYPANAPLLTLRASQLAWEGYWADSSNDHLQYTRAAMEAELAALYARPAYGQGWLKLLQYQVVDESGEELHQEARARLQKLKRWQ